MSWLIKLAIAALASVAGFYASVGSFQALYGSTLHEYGQPYHLTVLHQGRAGSALTGVNIGQYNATPMRLDLVQFTPEHGAAMLASRKMLLESDLKKGDSLSVYFKNGVATPMDEIGGLSYWQHLSIVAGVIAGGLAALLLYLISRIFWGTPQIPRTRLVFG